MGTWGPSIFSDDLALDIHKDYSMLLSIKKDNNEVEDFLLRHYSDILGCNNPDEDIFWFVLALCEWKKGRLSACVKEKALSALDSGRDLERWKNAGDEQDYRGRVKALEELRKKILSPMPAAKKIQNPKTRHCPWKVGSLLAYRILFDGRPSLEEHPCRSKYVLLRIIKIVKHPITKIFPTEYYDESMLVGLYNWIGDEIPDPKIVKDLEFTFIQKIPGQSPDKSPSLSLLDGHDEKTQQIVKTALASLFNQRTVTCVWFSWEPLKDAARYITYLGRDESYEHHIPDFFDVSLPACPICSYPSFDIILEKKNGTLFIIISPNPWIAGIYILR